VADPFPTCYLDGQYLPLAEARISPLDRGFLFADGVYDVVPVHRRRPFRLREHLKRLDDSLAAIHLANPRHQEEWTAIVQRLVAEAGASDLLVYVQVTRGAESSRNHLFPSRARPTVFAFASPYPAPSAAVLERGLSAVTLQDIRWDRCDIKSVALHANILLRQEASNRGADEALLVRDGMLLEGSSSSVFLCVGGALITPPNSHLILPGTTRDAVLELAQGWLPSQVSDIESREIRSAEELWIASAGRGVLPVTRVDGEPVGEGVPGPLWQEMYERLQRHLDDLAPAPAI
jgi:D-alanine transaminase